MESSSQISKLAACSAIVCLCIYISYVLTTSILVVLTATFVVSFTLFFLLIKAQKAALNETIQANLNQEEVKNTIGAAGKAIDNLSSKLAINSAEVSFFLETLAKSIENSSKDVDSMVSAAEHLASNTNQINESASLASNQANQALTATHEGASQLQTNVLTISELNKGIITASDKIQSLSEKASEIQDITDVIDSISAQTNLLALNAAIEAARAGEQGRGFAVVADEVRALASKTAEATEKIATMLTEMNQESSQTKDIMQKIVIDTGGIVDDMTSLSSLLHHINELITETSSANKHISFTLKEHDTTTAGISEAITNLHNFLLEKSEQTQSISDKAGQLSNTTESIFVELSAFETNSLIETMSNVAVTTANNIGALFAQHIHSGTITANNLFDYTYKEIPKTNPVKYHSPFDQFTDLVLPDIQEPLLQNHPQMIYAGAVDINGYFPTHNKCFSKPLTGDYDHDMVHNRTKRVFNDPTGIRCGSHTKQFLLQTYKRDTGEIMHDVSAPIFVDGKHWGGFRIGFKA